MVRIDADSWFRGEEHDGEMNVLSAFSCQP